MQVLASHLHVHTHHLCSRGTHKCIGIEQSTPALEAVSMACHSQIFRLFMLATHGTSPEAGSSCRLTGYQLCRKALAPAGSLNQAFRVAMFSHCPLLAMGLVIPTPEQAESCKHTALKAHDCFTWSSRDAPSQSNNKCSMSSTMDKPSSVL